jgi:hypothetical protein
MPCHETNPINWGSPIGPLLSIGLVPHTLSHSNVIPTSLYLPSSLSLSQPAPTSPRICAALIVIRTWNEWGRECRLRGATSCGSVAPPLSQRGPLAIEPGLHLVVATFPLPFNSEATSTSDPNPLSSRRGPFQYLWWHHSLELWPANPLPFLPFPLVIGGAPAATGRVAPPTA